MGSIDEKTEACGRCAMSSVVGTTGADADAEDRTRDPFTGPRIEVDDRDLRLANAPAVLLGRVKRRLDAVATRITYGR